MVAYILRKVLTLIFFVIET